MFPHYPECRHMSGPCTANCFDRLLRALRSYDLETELIAEGNLTPPLVCGSSATSGGGGLVLSRAACFDMFYQLAHGKEIAAGANIAYDFAVMAREDPDLLWLIFKMYDEGRVWDLQIAEALAAIAKGTLGIDPRSGRTICNEQGKPTGRYSLAYCTAIRLGRDDAKRFDFWRTRFGILKGLDLEEYPEDAKSYMVDDACNTVETVAAQVGGYFRGVDRNFGNLVEQADTAFCMHLWSIWGLRTNRDRVLSLRDKVEAAHVKVLDRYQALGFIRPDGTEDKAAVKRAVAIAYGASGICSQCGGSGKVPSAKTGNPIGCRGPGSCDCTGFDLRSAPGLPLAEKGGVSTSRDTKLESGDDDLIDYGENETERVRTTYIPALLRGLEVPICPRPNVLLVTGRTSYEGLIQLMPRHGGVRECFEARKGYVYFSVDYSAIQLCTLAQVCLWTVGYSHMADTINATGDPGMLHTALAAEFLGEPLDHVVEQYKKKVPRYRDARQGAKPFNFGFIGLMGEATLVLSKRQRSEGQTTGPDGRKYAGIRFCILLDGAQQCGIEKVTEWNRRPIAPTCKHCLTVAKRLKAVWFKKWSEVGEYHRWATGQYEKHGGVPCLSPPGGPYVDRWRAVQKASEACFTPVQGLESDGIKAAARRITRECYLDRDSVLYGTRPIGLFHDEVFGETPEHIAHLTAPRIGQIMKEEMVKYVPDVTIRVEPALMHFWSKDAEPRYDEAGKLIAWDN